MESPIIQCVNGLKAMGFYKKTVALSAELWRLRLVGGKGGIRIHASLAYEARALSSLATFPCEACERLQDRR